MPEQDKKEMADEMTQRLADAEEHRRTYAAIMRASGEIGVPFALALTVFFTNLVMANGIGVALIGAIVTYLVVFFVVRTFFSH
ncbi:MAG: hypothetical protein AB7P23_08535 [Amphiplicatus sp.]